MSLAREYLEECFAEDVSLQELAGVVGLSRYHLIRTFRESVGLPPHAYTPSAPSTECKGNC